MVLFYQERGSPQFQKSHYSVSYSSLEHWRPVGAVDRGKVACWRALGQCGEFNTLQESLLLRENLTPHGAFGERPVFVVYQLVGDGENGRAETVWQGEESHAQQGCIVLCKCGAAARKKGGQERECDKIGCTD